MKTSPRSSPTQAGPDNATLRRDRVPAWLIGWRPLVVLAALLLGAATTWSGAQISQLGRLLPFTAWVVASLLASAWLPVWVVNGVCGVLWVALALAPAHPALRRPRHLVLQLNRSLGHVEAFGAWAVVSLALLPPLIGFPTAAAALVMGGPALDDLVRRLAPAGTSDAQLKWMRRPLIFALTLLGMVLLMGLGGEGAERRLWLTTAGVAVGIALRGVATWWLWQESDRAACWAPTAHRLRDSVIASAILLGLVLGTIGPQAYRWLSRPHDLRLKAAECALSKKHAPARGIDLFLIADNQFHELRGQRGPSQLGWADSLVPVSRRPTVLDLLSGAAMAQSMRVLTALEAQRPSSPTHPRFWAHLGDLADIGCESEWLRAERALANGPGRPIGVAIGNHDVSFLGNFAFHPEWASACQLPSAGAAGGRPLHKAFINRRLRQVVDPKTQVAGAGLHGRAGQLEGRDAKPMLRQLGHLNRRPVFAVFLDTADVTFDWHTGNAAVQGQVSRAQLRWVEDRLPKEPSWLVLLLHHPFADLTAGSRDRLQDFSARHPDQVLAVVAAHTHLARHQRLALADGHTVPSLIIGSTTDPPQEAALLTLLPSDGARPRVRLRTMPVVDRGSPMTCPKLPGAEVPGAVRWSRCEAVFQGFQRQGGACLALLSTDPPGPQLDPKKLRASEVKRAKLLQRCVYRDEASGERADPLDGEQYTRRAREGTAAQREELVCLAWRASLLQGRKMHDWPLEKTTTGKYPPAGVMWVE